MMHKFHLHFAAITQYVFKDLALLQLALTHSSTHSSPAPDSERLEFLGDAVLGLVISEWLYLRYPNETEGDLAKRRAALVCHKQLVEVAKYLDLGYHMKVNAHGMPSASGMSRVENNGATHNPTILETTMEALLGAVFVESGYSVARTVIQQLWGDAMAATLHPPQDPKSALQEWSQGAGLGLPIYRLLSREGTSHAPIFTVQISVAEEMSCTASANSKREAEKEAARLLLQQIGQQIEDRSR